MKIAVVVSRFPAIAETFVLNHITGLLDLGHDVDILALDGYPDAGKKAHPLVDRYGLLRRRHVLDYSAIAAGAGARKAQAFGALLALGLKDPALAVRVLKDGQRPLSLRAADAVFARKLPAYDVVHCEFGDLAGRVAAMRRMGFLRGKYVVSLRGYDISGYVRLHGRGVYKPLFDEADLFLPNCALFLKEWLALGAPAQKSCVWRSGLRLEQFAYEDRTHRSGRTTQVLFTGRLVEKKGVEVLLRAFSKISGEGVPAELKLAGDGPLRPALETLARELGLTNRVFFVGEKTSAEIAELLREADIFAAPSVTAADGEIEGIPNTLKEAMASGLPVVSTRHAAIPELVEDGVSGFLVAERDTQTLAQKIRWLAEHPADRVRMGSLGRRAVEQAYDNAQTSREIVGHYERIGGAR